MQNSLRSSDAIKDWHVYIQENNVNVAARHVFNGLKAVTNLHDL